MEKIIKKYLKLYDYPFAKSLVDTFCLVSLYLLVPTLIISSALLQETLGMHWSFHFNWDFWGFDWLKDCLESFITCFTYIVLQYSGLFLLVVTGSIFIIFYIRRDTEITFVASRLFKKVISSIFISYFTFIVVNQVIRSGYFSNSAFLDKNWSSIEGSVSGIIIFSTLIVTWFLTSYACNWQSKAIYEEDVNKELVSTKLHDIRKEYMNKKDE